MEGSYQPPSPPGTQTAGDGIVSVQADGVAVPGREVPEGRVTCLCFTCRKNWVHITHLVGMVAAIGTIIFQFFQLGANLTKAAFADLLVCAYIMAFALLCLNAELRVLPFWRKIVRRCVVQMSFSVTYLGRGLVYVFMGSLQWDSTGIIGIILSVTCLVVGAIMLIVFTLFHSHIPKYPEDSPPLLENEQPGPGEQSGGGGGAGVSTWEAAKAVGGFANDHKEHITKENIDTAARVYEQNKEHVTAENVQKAQLIGAKMQKSAPADSGPVFDYK